MAFGFEWSEKEQVLDRLTAPDFDPAKTILIEKKQDAPRLIRAASRPASPMGQVQVLSHRPNHMALRTESSEAGLLFLSEVFYPGWKAFLDGQSTPILRGNYLFRVLEVPEGHHEVRLEFDPWTIKAGTGITLATSLLLMAVTLFLGRKRKASR
jgi:uncharacterized membrane protein YfhO